MHVQGAERMSCEEYLVICAREVLAARGDNRTPPRFSWELWRDFEPSIQYEAEHMVMEMFGLRHYLGHEWDEEIQPALYPVEVLTVQESAIAGRPDLTHVEKIEAIKPLRAKRAARDRARWRRARLQQEHEEMAAPDAMVIPQTFEQRISDADTLRARGWGISLA